MELFYTDGNEKRSRRVGIASSVGMKAGKKRVKMVRYIIDRIGCLRGQDQVCNIFP